MDLGRQGIIRAPGLYLLIKARLQENQQFGIALRRDRCFLTATQVQRVVAFVLHAMCRDFQPAAAVLHEHRAGSVKAMSRAGRKFDLFQSDSAITEVGQDPVRHARFARHC